MKKIKRVSRKGSGKSKREREGIKERTFSIGRDLYSKDIFLPPFPFFKA